MAEDASFNENLSANIQKSIQPSFDPQSEKPLFTNTVGSPILIHNL